MRKYVVPIVALVGIALLSPRADAANLVIKSRLGTPGRPVSLPVAVIDVGGTTQLWGLDFAVTFDTAKLSVGTDPGGNGSAFSPQAVTGSTEVPVVVSGTTFVGTVAANPNLYVGIVRGTSAFATTKSAQGAPTSSIGLLRMAVPAGGTAGDVVSLAVPTTYNVANDGTGSTTVARAGATGATSDATAGSAVAAEAITVLTTHPGAGTIHPPLNKVAIGRFPGDVLLQGSTTKVDSGDLSRINQIVLQKRVGTEYELIAGDISGQTNNYSPTNYGGTNGLSYGDGVINSGDISALKKQILGTAVNFPVSE